MFATFIDIFCEVWANIICGFLILYNLLCNQPWGFISLLEKWIRKIIRSIILKAKEKDVIRYRSFFWIYIYCARIMRGFTAKKHAYINSIWYLNYETLQEETIYYVPSTFLDIMLAFCGKINMHITLANIVRVHLIYGYMCYSYS